MDTDLAQIVIEEASRLELVVADLYTVFEKLFPEDAKFWRQLANEEKNHAALLISVKSTPNMPAMFLPDAANQILQEVIKTKELVTSLYIKFSENRPDRATALNTALQIEKTAWETHYQKIMTQRSDSWFMKVFQELNQYDQDHLQRITRYMQEKKIFQQTD